MARLKRCEACIKRHIKCVSHEQSCAYCISTGTECVWPAVPVRGSFVFSSENEFASGTVRRTRGPRKREPQPSESSSSSEASVEPQSSDKESTPLTDDTFSDVSVVVRSPPPTDLTQLALNKYYHCFLRNAGGMQSTLEGFIVQHGLPSPSTSSFLAMYHAMTSVIMVYFGLTEKSSNALTTSRGLYEQALQTTGSALRHTIHTSDELLLTIMLLGVYEGHTGDMMIPDRLPNTLKHVRGAATLLPLYQASVTSQSRFLHNIIYRRATRMALQAVLPIEPVVWTYIQHEEDPVLGPLYSLMGQLADINADLRGILELEPGMIRDMAVEGILHRAIQLEAKLIDLHSTMAQMDKYYTELLPQDVPCKSALAGVLGRYYRRMRYRSIDAAHELALMNSSRMRNKDIVQRCLKKLADSTSAGPLSIVGYDQLSSDVDIEVLAGDILASVPFFLGDVEKPSRTVDEVCMLADATHCGGAVFGLHSICSAYNTTSQQKKVAREAVLLISRPPATGILAVLFGQGGRYDQQQT